MAAVGMDLGGGLVRTRLMTEDIAPDDLHLVAEAPTDESVILVAHSGENAIVSTAGASGALPVPDVLAAIDAMAAGDLLMMQGNLGRTLTAAALREADERGLVTLLNPAPVAFAYEGLLELADIVVVNAVEAATLAPLSAPTVIVTNGPNGAHLRRGAETLHVPAPPRDAVDSSGAGDVVCGVVAAGLAQGLPLPVALRWAVAAASLKVTRAGAFAGLPRAAELRGLRP
jgi:ribokinase